MPVCIYCVTDKPASAFTKTEHVLPQAFGRFRNSQGLTLQDMVCDDCNEFFGNTLDRYLARDTPDGFNRFRLGYRAPEKYKSLGKASTMTHRVAEGPFMGAFLKQGPDDEGKLGSKLLPQVGFGPSPTGPFSWFLVSDLPTKEKARELIESGRRHLHFAAIQDTDEVKKDLAARGVQFEDAEVPPDLDIVGKKVPSRLETTAIIDAKFGRALAKIGLNYLASQCGAGIALMPQFNTVRECVRREKTLPLGSWASEVVFREGVKPGHILMLTWDAAAVVVRIAFHSWIVYRVVLAQGGFIIKPPVQARGHFYNLSAMTVEPFQP